jgi:hypothetical protein
VQKSAIFLLYLTEGSLSRPFVQKELREAFRRRKPMMWLFETDPRFGGGPDLIGECFQNW